MQPVQLQGTYLDLTTPHVADACMRLGIPIRCAPAGTGPVWSGTHLVGRVCPARHHGSVDVFLEAIDGSDPGDVLVVDNSGRTDEACVGDLVTVEASRAGLSGIVIWGLHRDTTELHIIRLPVFSLGALPAGPQRLDPQDSLALSSAACGQHILTAEDFVVGDDDGVVFVPLDRAGDVADLAASIRDTERSPSRTNASRHQLQEPVPLRRVHRGATIGPRPHIPTAPALHWWGLSKSESITYLARLPEGRPVGHG